MKQISILGCGWLGLPLAQQLILNSYPIHGATTSENKLSVLTAAGIKPFLITVSEAQISGNMSSFLQNSEVLILNIPPQLKGMGKESFTAKIRHIIDVVETSNITAVLFVSSTSVYADHNEIITEASIPQPDSESGRQLLEAEQLLRNNTNFQTTIIRFGGLIGNGRHPIQFLAGRKNIENPDAPINLIDIQDCIGIIKKIIINNIWNETFDAVAPFHPTRKNYYTQKAADLQLSPPIFTYENPSKGKTILSDKVIALLDYTFTHPNL